MGCKKIFQKLLFAVLIISLLITPISVFAQGEDAGGNSLPVQSDEPWITTRNLPPRVTGIDIFGYVPMLTSAFGTSYAEVNDRIDAVIDSIITEARNARARSVTFAELEYYVTGNMVSIVIEAYITTVISRTLVRSVNFCPRTGRNLTLQQALANNIVPLADSMLADLMRRYPERFYAATTVAGQPFYRTTSGVTILFDEFQLSAMVSEVYELHIATRNIQRAIVPASQTRPGPDGYNLITMRVITARELGFPVRWDGANGRVLLFRNQADYDNNSPMVFMYPGVNEYFTNDIQRSLEAAPRNFLGHIYVPITFFEQILPLTVYSIDSVGNVILLSYSG